MTAPRAVCTTQDLIDDAVSAAVAITGYPVDHVRAFIEPTVLYLLREYGGERLPKATRVYPVEEILKAVRAGVPRRTICRSYRIGTSTLYRLIEQANAPLELARSR
jgi:hypothetical protein